MRRYLWPLLFLAGCMLGPNYKAPKNDISDEWTTGSDAFTEEEPLSAWWQVFNDPLLDQYMEMAAEHNRELQAAEANILYARGLRQVAASKLFPRIISDINATKTYFSKNGPIFAIGPSTGTPTGVPSPTNGLPFAAQIPQMQNLFNVLFDALWEIDLFGKNRRALQAADAQIGSAIEEKNSVLITIMAEIGRNYIDLRSFQRRGQLIQENIEFLEQKAEIIQRQFDTGLVGDLDVEQIESTLAEERATLPQIHANIYRSIYAISLLTGDEPEALLDELLPIQSLPQIPETIALGVRSELLRRRPDIRKAERDLAAATAEVGVAVASFFPTFTLTGDIGLQSLSLKNLFELSSRTWAYGGDMSTPIFEGGKWVGTLHANKAAQKAAIYTYQQTVLKALEETEGALISYAEEGNALVQWNEAALRKVSILALTEERHQEGLINLEEVLDSQRELNVTFLSQLQSETSALEYLIMLYKALGGGWDSL